MIHVQLLPNEIDYKLSVSVSTIHLIIVKFGGMLLRLSSHSVFPPLHGIRRDTAKKAHDRAATDQ